MNRIVLIGIIAFAVLFSVGLLLGLTASWGLWDPIPKRPHIPSEDEVPDTFLITKANELPETKAFRDRYGEPHVSVNRVYGLDVWYTVEQCELKHEQCSTDQIERLGRPAAGLQIRMDSNGVAQSIVLWCRDGDDNTLEDRIDQNVIERLKTDTETCF